MDFKTYIQESTKYMYNDSYITETKVDVTGNGVIEIDGKIIKNIDNLDLKVKKLILKKIHDKLVGDKPNDTKHTYDKDHGYKATKLPVSRVLSKDIDKMDDKNVTHMIRVMIQDVSPSSARQSNSIKPTDDDGRPW